MDFSSFSVQQNEHSVHICVALLLSTALKAMQDTSLKVVPFLSSDLSHKKKGLPYTADFIITKDSNPTVEEGPTGRPDFVVFQKATPIVVIEVKVVIPVEFFKVKPHDCIELLIYCFYLVRLHKRDNILGILTDGES